MKCDKRHERAAKTNCFYFFAFDPFNTEQKLTCII